MLPALLVRFRPTGPWRFGALGAFYAVAHSAAEELYWRGLLLSASTGGRHWPVVLYSSLLFMVNHLWISVVAIGARNPAASAFQLVFGLLMCLIFLRTRSLRWPIAAHILVNLLTPTIAVFLNLYIPGAG